MGYDSEGPFPYSHVNKKPPPQTVQKTTPTPAVRNRPAAPIPANVSSVKVAKGDTVYAISRRYGVDVRSIINMNSLRAPYYLNTGQTLKLASGSTYRVKKGDTLYAVSRSSGILVSELVRVNGLKQPYALRVGQTLKLPGTSPKRAKPVAIAAAPQVSGKGFMWPIKGRLLSSYGPKQAGYHNDGVNISAAIGSSVVASESGVVVHASNKLKGYGNLILIKHQNGWVTAYAHNNKLLVKKGQQVTRGQVVAQVGQTGRVTRPQLHFEMRKGSRAVNPALYLKG
ncbi:MAG: M23 family metallopeptidase [Kordiimonadaceae bacterium]|nr:M23 family metallopeptidase [Kordiimonadaceae bacterium]